MTSKCSPETIVFLENNPLESPRKDLKVQGIYVALIIRMLEISLLVVFK